MEPAISASPTRLLRSALLLFLVLAISFCDVRASDTTEHCPEINCTGVRVKYICGTDGVTYKNRCEMNKEDCNRNIIQEESMGECVVQTVPEILKESETCAQHRTRVISYGRRGGVEANLWRQKCSMTRLRQLAEAGTITINDLIECYRPSCHSSDLNVYSQTQCYRDICWCSGPTGLYIDSTLSFDMEPNFCSRRNTCSYEGQEFMDGQVFQPPHKCGICECLDGNVTCFEDYVPDVQGRLNMSQVNQLSELLKQLFFFEDNHQTSILVDIRNIEMYISHIPTDEEFDTLVDRFARYDSNGDGSITLNHQEEKEFHNDIYQFTSCNHFVDHISEVIDIDGSNSITESEWIKFFNDDHTKGSPEKYSTGSDQEVPGEVPQKRSASEEGRNSPRLRRRLLENRTKFYYVTL